MTEKKITPVNPDKVSDTVEDQDTTEAERTTMSRCWARKTSSRSWT